MPGPLASLRAQVVALSLVAVLPLVALGLYGVRQWQTDADLRARQEVVRLAQLLANQNAGFVEGARQLLTTLALLPVVRADDPSACNALLAELLRQNPRYANFGFATPEGVPQCSALPFAASLNLADRSWFQEALARRSFVVGDYQIGRVVGRPVLTFATPVLNSSGRVLGVISAALDLAWLNASFASLDLPPGSVVQLIDDQGVILARQPDPEAWVGRQIPEAPLTQMLLRGDPAGSARLRGLDNVDRIYGFEHISLDENTGVHAMVGVPAADVFYSAQVTLVIGLVSLVGTTGLALTLALLLAERSILTPMRALVAQTRRVAAGDLSARAGQPLRGELGVLAAAFDQMAAALEARERERQTALETLAASEAGYRAIFTGAGDGIFIADSQGRFLEANPAGCQLLGYSADELRQRSMPDLMPAEAPPASPAPEPSPLRERRLRRADGGLLEAEIASTVLPDGRRLDIVRDRTAQHRLEADLRQMEAFLGALLEQLPAIVFVHELDGRMKLVNHYWETVFGWKRTAVLGRNITDFLPPAVTDDFLATSREVQRAGGPLSFERRLPVRGQLRCFQVIKYPVYNAAGEFEGVAGIALDITERQAAEAALRAREAQFRLISELTSDYTFSFQVAPDGALRLEWSLGAFERISGYPPAELEASDDWLALVHPADQPGLRDFLRARLADGTPGSHEFRLVSRSGASRQILGYFRPLPDETGQVGRLLGSGQDITERRQAEQALRLTQFTVDHAADAIFWIRPDGRLRAANEAAGRLLGYSHGELLARSVQDLEADSSAAAWSAQWEILRQRGTTHFETILRARDGRLFPAEVSASFLEFSGQTLACAFARDITERRRAAAELERLNADLEERVRERTARLEAANQEMETFSYSVSHDLRAPLRAITGFAAILAERHAASLNPEGRRYLDNIVTAGGRMSQLIDDLLAYSRVGRRAVRLAPVPLRPLLDEVIQELAARAAEARAEVNLPAELPLVRADLGLLRQIFSNLLENALLYHRPGVPPRIAITAQAPAVGQVVIAVADNGLGIRPEYQERIFDVFQRLHGDDQYPGTGLGLALVRKAAGLLNGMVWVESTEGQGSTFFVRLPAEAA